MSGIVTYEKINGVFKKTFVENLANVDSEIIVLEAAKSNVELSAKDENGDFLRSLTSEEQELVNQYTAALAVLRS